MLVLTTILYIHSGTKIEFGAQQCECNLHRCNTGLTNYTLGILVRDDAAREKLRARVGEIGLILYVLKSIPSVVLIPFSRTLYESKGLEFDDVLNDPAFPVCIVMLIFFQVLLFNFFDDSPVGASQWRVILNAVSGSMAPAFDETHHGGVCREVHGLRSLMSPTYSFMIPVKMSVRRHHSRQEEFMDSGRV